jgi:carotenoid cleavage dioxygenase
MRLQGTVTEAESGRPLEGLLVRAYDQDLLKDDHLGDTHTDAAGRFEISYTEVQFRDLNETLPDLYLRIFDRSGKRLLHSTEKQVRKNALVLERFEIRIPSAKLAGS